jgi:hypothetical protein
MSIVYSDASGVIDWPLTDLHDTLSEKYYTIEYRPDIWRPNISYIKGLDAILPLISNGCMYECISSGISGAIQPIFSTVEGKLVVDNDVSWRTITYSAILNSGDTISSSVWTASPGVTISDDEVVSSRATAIKVTSVLPTLCDFKLINTILINRASGRVEKLKRTLHITVGEL